MKRVYSTWTPLFLLITLLLLQTGSAQAQPQKSPLVYRTDTTRTSFASFFRQANQALLTAQVSSNARKLSLSEMLQPERFGVIAQANIPFSVSVQELLCRNPQRFILKCIRPNGQLWLRRNPSCSSSAPNPLNLWPHHCQARAIWTHEGERIAMRLAERTNVNPQLANSAATSRSAPARAENARSVRLPLPRSSRAAAPSLDPRSPVPREYEAWRTMTLLLIVGILLMLLIILRSHRQQEELFKERSVLQKRISLLQLQYQNAEVPRSSLTISNLEQQLRERFGRHEKWKDLSSQELIEAIYEHLIRADEQIKARGELLRQLKEENDHLRDSQAQVLAGFQDLFRYLCGRSDLEDDRDQIYFKTYNLYVALAEPNKASSTVTATDPASASSDPMPGRITLPSGSIPPVNGR